MRPDIGRFRNLAIELHGRQVDQAGRPYVEHLDDVVARLRNGLEGLSESEMYSVLVCGYLHDTLEDCTICERKTGTIRPMAPEDLLGHGLRKDEVSTIILLTRKGTTPPAGLTPSALRQWKHTKYLEKIMALELADEPGQVRLRAAFIKRADNLSNLSPRRAALLPPKKKAYWMETLAPRYRQSLELLNGTIRRLTLQVDPTSKIQPVGPPPSR